MKRDLSYSSISKIYIFLGIVSVAGLFLLFLFPRPTPQVTEQRVNRDFINQVLQGALPLVAKAWEHPSLYFPTQACALPDNVGEDFLSCHPQGWQCLWQKVSHLEVEHAGRKYLLRSSGKIRFLRRAVQGIHSYSGYLTEIELPELKVKQKIFLPKTCHEVYLPQRTYAYGEVSDPRDPGFLWDNAGRNIFIDKFYVSEGDVAEWKHYQGETYETMTPWKPAKLRTHEQIDFCRFHGKKRLKAHFFDASQMTPLDLKLPHPDVVLRPDTPWHRDFERTFLGKAMRDETFKPSETDCSLAQVEGCLESYFMTDSVSWSGIAYGLGFEEEQFFNPIEPDLNLKKSSRFIKAGSDWHKLGRRASLDEEKAYSFRCFREVI